MTNTGLHVAAEVAAALASGRAVVALESTIVTHGMPYPQNLAMARAVEGDIRGLGAVPATVAVMGSKLWVGLDDAALELLASTEGAAKASVRDLGPLLASGVTAGTTVAATMRIAALAGIGVFATGGIGGVHRGGEASLDISADLTALSRYPVAVVCAGCKSILDIPRTLEVLETLGVPVIGFGSAAFPAFFARDSGAFVEHAASDVKALAAMVAAHRGLGGGGVLITNPIDEEAALDATSIEAEIAAACEDAVAGGIAGKALTPFLLARINALTGGRSLTANIALVRGNARLAAQLAVALLNQ